MKLRLLVFFLLLSGSVYSQINKKLVKARNKQVTLTNPPMGIWLYDNVFIDETEIANIHWLEFEYYAKDSSEIFLDKIQPYMEEIEWSANNPLIDSSGPSFHPEYLRYPGFRYFPVVGITYEQAILYCEWRSLIVTNSYNQQFAEKKSNKRVYVHYRLPTEEEWEMAAKGFDNSVNSVNGLPTPIIVQKKKQPDTTTIYNFNSSTPFYYHNYVSHGGFGEIGVNTEFIYDYSSNAIGIYNMIGNVSEMIDQEGIAKGGNWRIPADSCTISSRQYYECPNTWTGFRCVAEVYEYEAGSLPKIISPLPSKNPSCSWINKRNEVNEYLRNRDNPEYLKAKLLTFQERFDSTVKAKLYYNNQPTYADQVVTKVIHADTLRWSIENIPMPDSILVTTTGLAGSNVMLPFTMLKFVNTNTFTFHQYEYDTENPSRNINGVIVTVYYKENGEMKEESIFRVTELKP